MARQIPPIVKDLCAEVYELAIKGNQIKVHRLNRRLVELVGGASPDPEVRARALRTADHLLERSKETL